MKVTLLAVEDVFLLLIVNHILGVSVDEVLLVVWVLCLC